jgi:hypothetical protein
MGAINSGSQANLTRDNKARYEQYVADYHKKVGQYPAMPLALSPHNGVPTTQEALDTFHKTVRNLGVTIKTDLPNNSLPLEEKGYKQLLNTCASIIENGSGFLGALQKILFEKNTQVGASMSQEGELVFEYIDDIASVDPSATRYLSVLNVINPFKDLWKGSLRSPTLATEHEAVHDLLMGACREFMKNTPFKSECPQYMSDDIMAFYRQQLTSKDPAVMGNAINILTNYFTFRDKPQELFTTLLEAKGAEIAARTPVTQAMADAVGSTVEHLTQQKDAHLPTVSPEQREQLAQLINLIKDTPFDVTGWWRDGISLRETFFRHLNLSIVNHPELQSLYQCVEQADLDFQYSDSPDTIINTFANLDKDHPEVYNFILSLDEQHPDLLGTDTKGVLHQLFESEKTANKKPLTEFIELRWTDSASTEVLESADYYQLIETLQKLHRSYKAFEANGNKTGIDELFKQQGIAEAAFLAEHAHLLDLPKRFMTMLEQLDEKELMITLLHRLV